jgi:hypothetical protein
MKSHRCSPMRIPQHRLNLEQAHANRRLACDDRHAHRITDVAVSSAASAVTTAVRWLRICSPSRTSMYPYVALRCPTYRENSHANHILHQHLHQTACFKDSKAPPPWVRFPSPAPFSSHRWPMPVNIASPRTVAQQRLLSAATKRHSFIPPLGHPDGCFAQTAFIGELPRAAEFLGLSSAIGNSVFPMATGRRWPPAPRARIVKAAARRAA